MLDNRLDPTRHPDVAAWERFRVSQGVNGCLGFLLVILTFGIWLLAMAAWDLLAIGPRHMQKQRMLKALHTCIRFHCRNCGLDFYEGERAA